MSEVNEVDSYVKPRGVVIVERDWIYAELSLIQYDIRRVQHYGPVNTKGTDTRDNEQRWNNGNDNGDQERM